MIPGLAPWEIAQIFRAPTFGNVTLPSTAPAGQIIAADSLRWALIISSTTSATTALISIDPNMQTSQGILISSSIMPFMITMDDWGPLVNAAWYGIGSSPALKISWIAVTVNQWPRDPNSKIILPWEQDEQAAADIYQQQLDARKAALRALMQQSGQLSQRWQNKGAF